MLKDTQVKIDPKKGTWEIEHTYDERAVMKDCYEQRMSGREGDIEGGKGKLICRIPRHRFNSDFELQMVSKYQGVDDIEANKWLNIWLSKNPEFRTTTGGRKHLS